MRVGKEESRGRRKVENETKGRTAEGQRRGEEEIVLPWNRRPQEGKLTLDLPVLRLEDCNNKLDKYRSEEGEMRTNGSSKD